MTWPATITRSAGSLERIQVKAAVRPATLIHNERIEFFQTCMGLKYAYARAAADATTASPDNLYRAWWDLRKARG